MAQGWDVRLVPYGNALIHAARNNLISSMRPDSDWVLFLDDDMVPENAALVRLLKFDVPAISALCTSRLPPVRPAVRLYSAEVDGWIPPGEAFPENTLLSGPFAVGAAFLLLRRDTVEKLKEYYLSARDWLDDRTQEMNRLHVRSEWREKERQRKEEKRRANFKSDKTLRIFEYLVGEDEQQLGEDISVCKKMIRLNIPMAIDTGTAVLHVGEKFYGPADWNPEAA